MEQYIPKSVLLAEIDRLVNNYDKALDYEAALEDVRNFIDSLEVTELQVKESEELQHVNETCKENGDSLTLDGVITFDYYDGDKAYGCVAHDSFCLEDRGLKDMDKVKILILKKY